ncbi:hypothetical protein CDG81_17305 [Actinopolyspora erythraea]|uniref:Metalloprotease n=1 Tax=Actinopolyspora erythraea TaxID=414996 RepID=A0A223RV28_9ACTN|nr:neutral zinc metallopeptidase [Actinopolyspora erythraea]ASU79730.1 hypothetical protein CDG81_17305 [Actinopolyspora erythraea]
MVLSGVTLLFVATVGLFSATSVTGAAQYRHGEYVTEESASPSAEPFHRGDGEAAPWERPSPERTPEEPTSERERPTGTAVKVPGDTDPRPVASLGEHPFNIPGNGAVETDCELPTFDTDTAAQRAFLNALAPCLTEMWTPALREANLPVETPDVVVTATDVHTPCGDREWEQTAMYCGSDHTIYWTARYYSRVEGRDSAGPYLGQFAHEFGHALQGMTGIIKAYGRAVQEAGGAETPEGLELSRRNELQATCYGGQALAALRNGGVDDERVLSALRDAGNRGDEASDTRDHGTTANNRAWVRQGFRTNRITRCNTWLAEDSRVS